MNDPLMEMKRLLKPGERLPRHLERQAEAWSEENRVAVQQEARELDGQREDEERVARWDAMQAEWEAEQDKQRQAEREARRRRYNC